MEDYTLAEQYAIIALNGQDSKHNTVAKKAAIMGIGIAKELQGMLDAGLLSENAENNSTNLAVTLSQSIKSVKQMNRKKRDKLEKEIAEILEARGVLEEIPNLLGCDINYYTAGITMKEYKSKEDEYQTTIESLRATLLEPGEVDIETVILIWLLRESGCSHDIFSIVEQSQIERRLIEIKEKNRIYKIILETVFHNVIRQGILKYLKWKHNLFKNPYLEGINLLAPFLDRKQAVFIDMVVLSTTVKDRREAAIQFLQKNGHTCKELKSDSETLFKIDNNYYRIWPSSMRMNNIPVQGIRLLPVYK